MSFLRSLFSGFITLANNGQTFCNSLLDQGNDEAYLCYWITLTFLLLIFFPVEAEHP